MKIADLSIRSVGSTQVQPRSSKLIHALRHLGYSFEQAVADLIDNSISAEATHVALRFVLQGDDLHSFVIADNGKGMSASKLEEAMRFGSRDDYHERALGKYGLGLKLASLSHAAAFDVITRHDGISAGRRWNVSGLSNDWSCDILDETDSARAMGLHAPGFPSGTVVIWHEIDKLSLGKHGVLKGLRQLQDRLHMHVGLHFHRFIEAQGLRIVTEVVDADSRTSRGADDVMALNPFAYTSTGHPEYPRTFAVEIPGSGALPMRACIWPANSKGTEYRLGGKAAQRQGFYFYRRDRLIQAGGWNGVVEHETEPHSSLARIAVDLPAEMDAEFGLSVQKSKVVTPPSFVSAVSTSKDTQGEFWLARYRKAANQAYRQDDRAIESYPLLPGAGLPRDLIDVVRDELADGRQRKIRNVRFQWKALSGPDFFEIDREQLVVRLNKNYRSAVLRGRRGSPSDAPLLKLLLFFVLEAEIDSGRLSAARKERLDAINRLLSQAVQHEDRD